MPPVRVKISDLYCFSYSIDKRGVISAGNCFRPFIAFACRNTEHFCFTCAAFARGGRGSLSISRDFQLHDIPRRFFKGYISAFFWAG